jgi:hypothetical protein
MDDFFVSLAWDRTAAQDAIEERANLRTRFRTAEADKHDGVASAPVRHRALIS